MTISALPAPALQTMPAPAPTPAPAHPAKRGHRARRQTALPPIGQGPYTTALWPAWLPRTPAEGPTAPHPLRCALHGEALHVGVEHPLGVGGRGLEVGVYSVRVVVWCAACDRAVASEERVRFVPGRWRDRSAQLLLAATHDTYVREHALLLFHAFARGGWRLYDQLYATQQGQESQKGRAGPARHDDDDHEPDVPEGPEGVA